MLVVFKIKGWCTLEWQIRTLLFSAGLRMWARDGHTSRREWGARKKRSSKCCPSSSLERPSSLAEQIDGTGFHRGRIGKFLWPAASKACNRINQQMSAGWGKVNVRKGMCVITLDRRGGPQVCWKCLANFIWDKILLSNRLCDRVLRAEWEGDANAQRFKWGHNQTSHLLKAEALAEILSSAELPESKTPRRRKPNFPATEVSILTEKVMENVDVLHAKLSNWRTNRIKSDTWEKITGAVNAVGRANARGPRQVEESPVRGKEGIFWLSPGINEDRRRASAKTSLPQARKLCRQLIAGSSRLHKNAEQHCWTTDAKAWLRLVGRWRSFASRSDKNSIDSRPKRYLHRSSSSVKLSSVMSCSLNFLSRLWGSSNSNNKCAILFLSHNFIPRLAT